MRIFELVEEKYINEACIFSRAVIKTPKMHVPDLNIIVGAMIPNMSRTYTSKEKVENEDEKACNILQMCSMRSLKDPKYLTTR